VISRSFGLAELPRWTVAAGYGEGFPVPLLKQWIDKIGF
jgi:hypothetical protein